MVSRILRLATAGCFLWCAPLGAIAADSPAFQSGEYEFQTYPRGFTFLRPPRRVVIEATTDGKLMIKSKGHPEVPAITGRIVGDEFTVNEPYGEGWTKWNGKVVERNRIEGALVAGTGEKTQLSLSFSISPIAK